MKRPPRTRSLRPAAPRLLVCAALLLLPAAAVRAGSEPVYYRLALAPLPPPCVTNEGTPAGASGRCFGTRPDVTELEMSVGTIVYLDAGDVRVPAAWIFAGPLLLHTAELLAPGLGYRFRESAGGLRLEIHRGDRMLSTPVELERWQPARTPDGDEIWFRAERVP